MDPLQLLREFACSGRLEEVSLEAEDVKFGSSYSFPRSTLVSYKQNKGRGDHYPLEAVVYFIRNVDQAVKEYAVYRKNASGARVAAVQVLDRGDLADYLQGRKETSECIQPLPLAAVLVPAPEAPAAAEGDAARGAADEGERRLLGEVRAHERVLVDRLSVLRCPRKHLGRVLDMAKRVGLLSAEERKRYLRGQAEGPKGVPPPAPRAIPTVPSNRDRRPPDAASYFVQRGVPDPAALGIVTGESRQAGSSKVAKRSADAAPAQRPADKRPRKRGSSIPIIVVPKGAQAKLTMHNAPEFLEQSRYVPALEARQAKGIRKDKMLVVRRTVNREEPVLYHVVEDFPSDPDEASRVAACFVQGARWQFKGWPFKGVDRGDMVDCFEHVRGFYLRFQDEAVPKDVASWNVRVLTLNRDNRYEDAAVALQFWDALDEFVSRAEHLRDALTY